MKTMISVAEAKELIEARTAKGPVVKVPLSGAAWLVLARDIHSPLDIPAYAQSSMDGYALRRAECRPGFGKPIAKNISSAGTHERYVLAPGEAMRIFTGAAVPEGADVVVMQEKTRVEEGVLFVEDEQLQEGLNVRQKGSEIRSGELALAAGSRLHPAAIGFLSMLGITQVDVYLPPSVCIIVTGNELVDPGQPIQHGQVYESNSHTLRAVLAQMGIHRVSVVRAPDSLETLTRTLEEAMQGHDMILLNGGISVGDFDFVLKATKLCGIGQVFHKIRQKPGKPIYFGTRGEKIVFGLPGNPASVLTCFYEYVTVCLRQWYGADPGITVVQAPLAAAFRKPAGLTHFLKGFYDGRSAQPLDAQESYRLSSFARANALIVIDEGVTHLEAGSLVELHLLPV